MPSKYGLVAVFMTLSSTAADSFMYDGIGMLERYNSKLSQISMRGEEERQGRDSASCKIPIQSQGIYGSNRGAVFA